MSGKARKRDTLNTRIRQEEPASIGRAVEEALLDRAIFTVSRVAYATFLGRLDASAQSNEALRRTMQTSAPWDCLGMHTSWSLSSACKHIRRTWTFSPLAGRRWPKAG